MVPLNQVFIGKYENSFINLFYFLIYFNGIIFAILLPVLKFEILSICFLSQNLKI